MVLLVAVEEEALEVVEELEEDAVEEVEEETVDPLRARLEVSTRQYDLALTVQLTLISVSNHKCDRFGLFSGRPGTATLLFNLEILSMITILTIITSFQLVRMPPFGNIW